jgi:hypothetical protein
MNEEQKPTITVTADEGHWLGRLLTILKCQTEESLQMLLGAVRTGESKPDNPNIDRDRRVLGYLKPLHKKIAFASADVTLSAVEAGQLDKLIEDARENQDYEYTQEIEEAKEDAEAMGEEFSEYDLSDEARLVYELQEIVRILRPLSQRLEAGKFTWPKEYED